MALLLAGLLAAPAQATWQLTYSNEFTKPLGSEWELYWGEPGSDPGGWWDPSHVSVSGGTLDLRTYRDPATCILAWGCTSINDYVSGGVKLLKAQTYGKYEVRLRADNATGVPIVALLWPASNGWPPEVDFAEDRGESPRTTNTATLHWGTWEKPQQSSHEVKVNMSEWHTWGVEWSRERITYTVDGRAWATATGSTVPSVPMELALQAQTWNCGQGWELCPNTSTPSVTNYDIDWVAIYSEVQTRGR